MKKKLHLHVLFKAVKYEQVFLQFYEILHAHKYLLFFRLWQKVGVCCVAGSLNTNSQHTTRPYEVGGRSGTLRNPLSCLPSATRSVTLNHHQSWLLLGDTFSCLDMNLLWFRS